MVGTHGFAIDEQLNLNFVRDIAMKQKSFSVAISSYAGIIPGAAFAPGRCHR